MTRLSGLLRITGFLLVIILFVGIAIANRTPVLINLDPFAAQMASLGLRMPLFIALFGAFIIGFAAGAISLWLGSRRQRIEARAHRKTERVAQKIAVQQPATPSSTVEPQLQAKNEAHAASRLPLTG